MQKGKQLSGTEIVQKLQETIQLHKSGMIQDAIVSYEEIIPLITATPTLLQLHGNVGALYLSTGDYERAKSHFEESIKIDKTNALAHFNLAVLLTSKMNQHAAALKHCAIAIKLDKDNYKFYHLMGNILQSLGKDAESEKYFRMAEELAASQSSTSENLHTGEDSRSALQSIASSLPFSIENCGTQTISFGEESHVVTVVSTSPLIFTVDNFLTDEECKYIREQSISKLEKSFIMGNAVNVIEEGDASMTKPQLFTSENENTESLYRSSYNAWLPLDQRLSSVQTRVSKLLGLPLGYVVRNSEDLQVVRYDVNGQFKLHQDSSAFHSRLLTILFYLNDIPEEPRDGSRVGGGETWFPFANTKYDPARSVERSILEGLNIYDEYAQSRKLQSSADFTHEKLPGIAIKPSKGKVVVFWNYDIETEALDPNSIHAGLPIRKFSDVSMASSEILSKDGEVIEKWVANYWIKFNKEEIQTLMSN